MRGVALVLTLIMVLGTVSVVGVASPSETNEDVRAGEEVSAALMVSEAELEAELEVRSYARAIQHADDPDARAELIAQRVSADEERLTELQDRVDTLTTQYENGEISEGKYRAQVAVAVIQMTAIERKAEQSASVAPDLEEHLAERNVSLDKIGELRENASNLSGEDVSDIAKDIAGSDEIGPADDVGANVSVEPGEGVADDHPLDKDKVANNESTEDDSTDDTGPVDDPAPDEASKDDESAENTTVEDDNSG